MPESVTQPKIAIVTFNQGSVHHGFASSLARTFAAFPGLVWLHMPTQDKNVLLPMIDRSEVDIVVWINPNIIWTNNAFQEVIDPIARGFTSAAGALYHNHRDGGGLVPVKLEFENSDLDPLRGYTGPLFESGSSMYLRARRLPFGFLAVKRDALITASRAAPKYKLSDEGERETRRLFQAHVDDLEERLTDEDHAACDYLRVTGSEIWVSMDVSVLHVIGGHVVGEHDRPPRIHEFAAEMAKSKVKK